MTYALTGSELAATIEKVVTMLPETHDQGYWFFTYDAPEHFQAVDPESIQLVQIMDAVEAGEEAAKDVSCQTTLCTAGWALLLNGYTLEKDEFGDHVAVKDNVKSDIFNTARDLLGIDYTTANYLFQGDTSNDDAVTILGYLGRQNEDAAKDFIADLKGGSDDYDDYDDDDSDYDY